MKKRAGILSVFLLLLVPLLASCSVSESLYRLSIKAERWLAGLTPGSVQVDDHRVCYLEGGKGETILLVHGFSADKDNWNRLARLLTPHYRVVAIDVPGFGESSKLAGASYGVPSQVSRLDRVVAALGLDRFHLAGNSMGGAIAAEYAARFPDKVLSLALLDTAGVSGCPRRSELSQLLEKGDNPLLVSRPEDFDRVLDMVFVKRPWVPGSVKTYLARQAVANREFDDKIFHDLHLEEYAINDDLPRIRARTLILWGDTDRLTDASCTQVLEQGLPESVTVVMKDCGHIPMIERPKETANHYLKFLQGPASPPGG